METERNINSFKEDARILADRAATADDSADAQRYAQAALSIAQAYGNITAVDRNK